MKTKPILGQINPHVSKMVKDFQILCFPDIPVKNVCLRKNHRSLSCSQIHNPLLKQILLIHIAPTLNFWFINSIHKLCSPFPQYARVPTYCSIGMWILWALCHYGNFFLVLQVKRIYRQ
jgi:hypothetical protein